VEFFLGFLRNLKVISSKSLKSSVLGC